MGNKFKIKLKSRHQKLAAIIRELGQQSRSVFYLADRVQKNGKEDVEEAMTLAEEMLKHVSENCLLKDLPLVVACMQWKMLRAYEAKFKEQAAIYEVEKRKKFYHEGRRTEEEGMIEVPVKEKEDNNEKYPDYVVAPETKKLLDTFGDKA